MSRSASSAGASGTAFRGGRQSGQPPGRLLRGGRAGRRSAAGPGGALDPGAARRGGVPSRRERSARFAREDAEVERALRGSTTRPGWRVRPGGTRASPRRWRRWRVRQGRRGPRCWAPPPTSACSSTSGCATVSSTVPGSPCPPRRRRPGGAPGPRLVRRTRAAARPPDAARVREAGARLLRVGGARRGDGGARPDPGEHVGGAGRIGPVVQLVAGAALHLGGGGRRGRGRAGARRAAHRTLAAEGVAAGARRRSEDRGGRRPGDARRGAHQHEPDDQSSSRRRARRPRRGPAAVAAAGAAGARPWRCASGRGLLPGDALCGRRSAARVGCGASPSARSTPSAICCPD